MDCKKVRNNLIFLIEKEVSSDIEKELSVHLNSCPECLKLYEELSETYKAINTSREIEPKAFFAESIINKINVPEKYGIDNSSLLEKFFLDYFKKIAISGIALVVLIIVFFYITEGSFLFNYFSESNDLTTENVSTLFFDN